MTHSTTLAAGIDTAKDKLDVAVHPSSTRLTVENRPSGYKHLVIELRRNGAVLSKQTVTASEGAPARGTFSLIVHAPSPGAVTVVAYSPSAADGTPQHEQEVAVTAVKP